MLFQKKTVVKFMNYEVLIFKESKDVRKKKVRFVAQANEIIFKDNKEV